MRRTAILVSMVAMAALLPFAPVLADPPQRAPFTRSLSNTTPLVFGMSAAEAAGALGAALEYVSGTPGNEVLAAARPNPVYMQRDARLFLQFRAGRLTGWKGDWGRNWMWE